MKGDAIGNITHLNSNKGDSTKDYSICNKSLYDCVVLPLNEISDHSKIVTIFKSTVATKNVEKDNYKWKPLTTKFKWNDKTKQKFINALENNDFLINEISQRIEAGLIDSTAANFQALFTNAAEIALERKENPKKIGKKRKNQKNGLMWNVTF